MSSFNGVTGGLKLNTANPEAFFATVGRIIGKRVGGVCWDGGNRSRINPILYTLYSGLVIVYIFF